MFRSWLFAAALASTFASAALAQSSADLSVIKDGPGEAAAGSDVAYTVTITNGGPDAAANATLSDPVPTGMTFVSATQNNGPTFTCDTTVTCTIASLAAGQSAEFTFVFHIPNSAQPGDAFVNTATASSESLDENPENDSAVAGTSVSGTPASADLYVMKDGPAATGPNTDVTYTITIGNGGSTAATTVTFSDTLPGTMTFVSFTHESGPVLSCTTPAVGAGGTINCNVASFAGNTTSTYTLVGHVGNVQPGTEFTNTATVSASNDTNPENDSSSTTLVTSSVDVSVVKSGPASADAGTNIDYTIVVTNAGPDIAIPVLLHDALPPNTTLVSLTQTSGQPATCTDNDCTITQLGAGQSTTFTLTLVAGNTTSITNTATVSSGQYDTDATNDSSSATTTITPVADLGVTKSAAASVQASTNATFTVTVTNNGPTDASNVTVSDPLPPNTTFVSATQTSGPTFACDATITCTIATFAAGATATFDFVVNVDPNAGGTLSNTVTVSSATQDPNSANDSDTTSSALTPAPADLSITKTASANTAAPNTPARYTIVVTNNGPGTATGVVVTDELPPGVTLVSASGSCTGTTTITCNVGTLANGASSTITLDVILPQNPGEVVNTASADANEDDATGATANATIVVLSPAAIPTASTLGLAILAIALAFLALRRTW